MKNTRITPLLLLLSLTLLTGCLDKEKILTVPDAENILFTSTGDLIVTGGNGVRQVTRHTDANGAVSYSSRNLFPDFSCNFTGLAQRGEWVFTSCVKLSFLIFKNNHLLAAKITDENYRFHIISPSSNDPLDSLSIPNGMAFSPDGKLLIADENFLAPSGVARVSLDLSGERPVITGFEKNWVGPNHGLQSANGLKVDGHYLYLSDGDSVKRFAFDASNNIPIYVRDSQNNWVLNETVMWQAPGAVVDDIQTYCGGVALTSFLSGRIHYVASYLDSAGNEHFPVLYSSPPFGFESPSSLAIGAGPWFDGKDLLVTEKGLLFDLNSGLGNQLTRASLSMDLQDPDACLMVAEAAREKVEG